ncbi:hypothetical protein [Plantactinospora sonchi]|uniref:Uncharacterized protein n=1 Tax=Plantactinospora sonchi TaxID=1544735 RepID=A0ABU7RQM0_9ACTN
MAEFHVDDAGLAQLAKALEEAFLDACQIQYRLANHAELPPGGEGLLNAVRGGVQHTYRWGQEHTKRIALLLSDTGRAVESAGKRYRESDDRAAQALDSFFVGQEKGRFKELPPPRTGRLFQDGGVHGVEWYLQPGNNLREPPNFEYQFNHLADTLSPSAHIRNIVYQIFNYDIFEFFLQWIAGDWNGLWSAGSEFQNAGAAVECLGNNVVAFANDLPAVWRGNAADGCRDYLLRLGQAISAQEGVYRSVGAEYQHAAKLAYQEFELAGAVLGMLLDKLIEIGIAIAAGTATIETVVGGVIGYGVAAYLIKQAYDLWTEFNKIFANLDTIIKSINYGLSNVNGSNGVKICALPLPPAPYKFAQDKAGPIAPTG